MFSLCSVDLVIKFLFCNYINFIICRVVSCTEHGGGSELLPLCVSPRFSASTSQQYCRVL
ncbi:hypothetical protein Bca4012_089050 [Brassica carinata]